MYLDAMVDSTCAVRAKAISRLRAKKKARWRWPKLRTHPVLTAGLQPSTEAGAASTAPARRSGE